MVKQQVVALPSADSNSARLPINGGYVSSFVSAFKCKKCFYNAPALAPHLVDSGHGAPYDGKCPICDTIHNLKTGEVMENTEDMYKFTASSKIEEKDEKSNILKNFLP